MTSLCADRYTLSAAADCALQTPVDGGGGGDDGGLLRCNPLLHSAILFTASPVCERVSVTSPRFKQSRNESCSFSAAKAAGLMLQNGNFVPSKRGMLRHTFFLWRLRRGKKFWADLYLCLVYYIFIVFCRRGSEKAPQNLVLAAFCGTM